MDKSNQVAAEISEYVNEDTLDLSCQELSVWTDALRDAVLEQLSDMIDTDEPITKVDLECNHFDAATLARIKADISSDPNAPEEIVLDDPLDKMPRTYLARVTINHQRGNARDDGYMARNTDAIITVNRPECHLNLDGKVEFTWIKTEDGRTNVPHEFEDGWEITYADNGIVPDAKIVSLFHPGAKYGQWEDGKITSIEGLECGSYHIDMNPREPKLSQLFDLLDLNQDGVLSQSEVGVFWWLMENCYPDLFRQHPSMMDDLKNVLAGMVEDNLDTCTPVDKPIPKENWISCQPWPCSFLEHTIDYWEPDTVSRIIKGHCERHQITC